MKTPTVAEPHSVVRVTPETHGFIRALEEAAGVFDTLDPLEESEKVMTAYRNLSLAREALYEHIERLESKTARWSERSVVLRF